MNKILVGHVSGEDLSERSISSFFKLASHQNTTVDDMLKRRGRGGQGLVHFTRPSQDWEMEGFSQFLEFICTMEV